MRYLIGAVALAYCGLALPAAAQQEIGSYNTWISPQDARNSDGKALTSVCAMVQQDRANYHRFDRPDRYDGHDLFFGSVEARAVISSNCGVREGLSDYILRSVARGEAAYIHVTIFGQGNRVTGVGIREGAG